MRSNHQSHKKTYLLLPLHLLPRRFFLGLFLEFFPLFLRFRIFVLLFLLVVLLFRLLFASAADSQPVAGIVRVAAGSGTRERIVVVVL